MSTSPSNFSDPNQVTDNKLRKSKSSIDPSIPGPRPVNPDDDSEQDPILYTKDGRPKDCYANIITALTKTPEWQGVLAYNEFSHEVVVLKSPPGDPESKRSSNLWGNIDDSHTLTWLNNHGQNPHIPLVIRAVEDVAKRNCFHPVKNYLTRLVWDKKPRINNWLHTYLGSELSGYTKAVGPKWLISAVARIFQPGCKADCCLILEGKQGLKKSTSLKVLAGEDWFTDEIPNLGHKDAAIQISGVWILEFAEMSIVKKSGQEHTKAFMSRSTDRYRPYYSGRAINAPRQCIFAATVNQTEYLEDETGGRRFWPVSCGAINVEKLAQDRNQLWAEAYYQFKRGASWWLDTQEQEELAEAEQLARYEGDVWDDRLSSWLVGKQSTTTIEVLESCLGMDINCCSKSDRNRVGKFLRSRKWAQKQEGVVWTWRPFRR